MVDQTDAVLKRAAYILIAYAIIDALFGLLQLAALCAGCTPEQTAFRTGRGIGVLASDLLIGTCSYYGMRRRTGAFITVLVIMCIRVVLALMLGQDIIAIFTAFFAYSAYVGTAKCITLDRSAAVYEAIRRLPPPEPDPPPPPPWLPPRTGTWPPR
jgi:hypothetical protein